MSRWILTPSQSLFSLPRLILFWLMWNPLCSRLPSSEICSCLSEMLAQGSLTFPSDHFSLPWRVFWDIFIRWLSRLTMSFCGVDILHPFYAGILTQYLVTLYIFLDLFNSILSPPPPIWKPRAPPGSNYSQFLSMSCRPHICKTDSLQSNKYVLNVGSGPGLRKA